VHCKKTGIIFVSVVNKDTDDTTLEICLKNALFTLCPRDLADFYFCRRVPKLPRVHCCSLHSLIKSHSQCDG